MNLPNPFTGSRTDRRVAIILGLTVLVVAAAIGIGMLRPGKIALPPPSHFDPRACVRLLDVSRVYKIKPWDADSNILWFTTAEGIRVLDQRTAEWTRYGQDHGLPSEIVSDICFMDGRPWIGTWNGIGWSGDSLRTFTTPPAAIQLRDVRILAIESLPGVGVFVSVDGKGLFAIEHPDSAPRKVEMPGVKNTDRITCLKTAGSTLFVGCEGRRLFAYDPRTRGVDSLVFERNGSPKTLVWDVLDHRGTLWVATSDDGLWQRQENDTMLRSVQRFAAKGAYCFAEEEDGFWCGTPFGLWRYHDDGAVWIQFVHPEQKEATDFQVFSLFSTPEALWYGSMDLGPGFLTKSNVEWHPMRAGLSNPNIAAIAAQDSFFWTGYGYQGGYLDRFLSATVQYDRNYGYLDGIGDDHVQSMTYSDSILYYGTYRGFGYFDPYRGRRRYFGAGGQIPFGDIAQIVCSPDRSRCYLAGQFGIIVFDRRSESFEVLRNTSQYRVTCILPDGDSLWFGTLGHGVRVFASGSGAVTPGPVIQGSIVAVEPWSGEARRIFVATKEDGWYIVDRGGAGKPTRLKPPAFNEATEPGSEFAGQIMAARRLGDHIWLGTREQGCIVVSTVTGSSIRLTEQDGLVSNQVRSFSESTRYVWVGCYGGLNRCDKEYLRSILPD